MFPNHTQSSVGEKGGVGDSLGKEVVDKHRYKGKCCENGVKYRWVDEPLGVESERHYIGDRNVSSESEEDEGESDDTPSLI